MAREIGAEEARQQLPRLLDDAQRGQVTIVTKWGKPYAAIVPLEALAPAHRGESLLALAGTGHGLYGDADEQVRQLRDEWDS